MLHIYKSQKQLPTQQKFSYRTAQEYCDLVQRSIKKQRSISKQDKKLLITSRNTAKIDNSIVNSQKTSKERLRHLVMRSKLNDRSMSVGDRSQSGERSLENNQKHNFASPDVKRRIIPGKRLISRKTITSYEQQHLILNLQQQNKQLEQAINQNELKILKLKEKIEEQRSVQDIQRDLYLQQVKKLKQTLQRQSITRSTTRLQQDQCSFGKQLSSQLLDLTQ